VGKTGRSVGQVLDEVKRRSGNGWEKLQYGPTMDYKPVEMINGG
jgi:hypothetical protein